MGRVEEILEVAEIVGEAADRLAAVLERSGARARPGGATLREIARHELGLAAADVGLVVFGGPTKGVPE